MNTYQNIQKKKLEQLRTTAQDFFHFIESFGELHNLNNKVSIWMLEDPIQKLDTFTYGSFQFLFFENLFEPNENSKIQNHRRLTKKAIETLLNEIFTTNKQENKEIIQKFMT